MLLKFSIFNTVASCSKSISLSHVFTIQAFPVRMLHYRKHTCPVLIPLTGQTTTNKKGFQIFPEVFQIFIFLKKPIDNSNILSLQISETFIKNKKRSNRLVTKSVQQHCMQKQIEQFKVPDKVLSTIIRPFFFTKTARARFAAKQKEKKIDRYK